MGMMRVRRRLIGPALVFVLLVMPACHPTIKTGVSPVADIENAGGKIQESAHAILVAVQQSHQANPTVITTSMLDLTALAVNKVGHAGLDLGTALDAYNQAKAAGSDTTQQKLAIATALNTITDALNSIGKAIPSGTLAAVDQLATSILGVVAQVKGATGL